MKWFLWYQFSLRLCSVNRCSEVFEEQKCFEKHDPLSPRQTVGLRLLRFLNWPPRPSGATPPKSQTQSQFVERWYRLNITVTMSMS